MPRRLAWWGPAALLAAAACSGLAPVQPERGSRLVSAEVVEVASGDTLQVRLDGRRVTVRLLGVDAPDLGAAEEPYGREAAAWLRRRAQGRTVLLDLPEWGGDDRAGVSALVFAGRDGACLNQELIARGFARAYTPLPFPQLDAFLRAEASARRRHLGLWGLPPGREGPAQSRGRQTTLLLQLGSLAVALAAFLLAWLRWRRGRTRPGQDA